MFYSDPQQIKTFIFFCYLLILILITFVLVVMYLYKQKQEIYYRNLNDLKIRHENFVLQTQIEIQEQTFEKISREIHDNIGQKLSVVNLLLGTISNDYDDERITNSITAIAEAIIDIRDLSHSMSSENLLNGGFIKAIRLEISHFKTLDLFEIDFTVNGEEIYFEKSRELILFRIVQEALSNIIKHSRADYVIIGLNYLKANLNLFIKDNGKGFYIQENKSNGIGLINMKKRAAIIGADFKITSNPFDGTQLTLKIPYHEHELHTTNNDGR